MCHILFYYIKAVVSQRQNTILFNMKLYMHFENGKYNFIIIIIVLLAYAVMKYVYRLVY